MNVCPPTDDKPFFFNMNRLSQIGQNTANDAPADPSQILMLTLGILVVLSLVAFLLPLRLREEHGRRSDP